MNKLRVLLADDHALIRDGVKGLINGQADMEVIGEAGDGREAWHKVKSLQPDILILDITMPDLNGVQATERIKRDVPNVKVLILTAHEDKGFLQQMLQAGVSGYMLKRAAAAELIRAIRVVAAGGIYIDPEIASKIVTSYVGRQSSRESVQGGDLSEREEEVLRLIAWGHSNKEIAVRLNISVKTVEGHKSKIMEKLGLKNRVEVVRYALHRGWLQDQ
ncbi:MAG: response regulator transcription factor [Acidobacteria bacterium]|nr:response regulator transcription factor [Acidobacteriota bacterium]